MVQWATKLSQFDIEYHPRTTVKAQALADFIAEFTLLDKEDRVLKLNGGQFRRMVRQHKERAE